MEGAKSWHWIPEKQSQSQILSLFLKSKISDKFAILRKSSKDSSFVVVNPWNKPAYGNEWVLRVWTASTYYMHSDNYGCCSVAVGCDIKTCSISRRLCMIRDTLRTGCTPWKSDDNTVLLLLFVSFHVHTYIFYYKLQWVWHNDGFLFAWIFLFIWVHKKKDY